MYLHLLHAVVGALSREQLPHHDAHAVHVRALVVLVAGQHLWRHPVDRSHVRRQYGVIVAEASQTEVADLNVEGLVQQQVGGLEVAVDDGRRVPVQVDEAAAGALQDAPQDAHRPGQTLLLQVK